MRRIVVFGSAVLILVLAALALLLPLPNLYRSPWVQKLLDLGHVPLFAVVTVCLWQVVGKRTWLAFGLAATAAVAAEIGQGFAGRSQNSLDVLRGLIGAVIGILMLFVLRRPLRWRTIAMGLATALALAAWPIWDSVPVLVDAICAYRSFPVLSDFSSPSEARRWFTTGAALERQAAAEQGRPWVGRLLVPSAGGGVILFPVVRNWSAYRRLYCTFSFSGDPLQILISVRDGQPVERPRRRFDLERHYAEGRHCVVIDLGDLAAGTHFAPLDVTRIQSFHFVVANSAQPRTLVLHTVYLE